MTPKDEQKNARLLKKYGISLQEYEDMLKDQGYGCKICHKKPKDGQRSLHVEHDHSHTKCKVKATNLGYAWEATAEWRGDFFRAESAKRTDAVAAVRLQLLRASIRGCCCWHCNQMLKTARDSAEILRSGANYLENFERRDDKVH